MRILPFKADELVLRDVAKTDTPMAAGAVDVPCVARLSNVSGMLICVERRDRADAERRAAQLIERSLSDTRSSSFIAVPFFHLSSRASVPHSTRSAEAVRKRIHSVASALAFPMAVATFGYHKEMTSTGFCLLGRGALLDTAAEDRPAIDLVACRSVLHGRKVLWIFVWCHDHAVDVPYHKIRRDVTALLSRANHDDHYQAVITGIGNVRAERVASRLSEMINSDVFNIGECEAGLPVWRVPGEPGAVVYRSYE